MSQMLAHQSTVEIEASQVQGVGGPERQISRYTDRPYDEFVSDLDPHEAVPVILQLAKPIVPRPRRYLAGLRFAAESCRGFQEAQN